MLTIDIRNIVKILSLAGTTFSRDMAEAQFKLVRTLFTPEAAAELGQAWATVVTEAKTGLMESGAVELAEAAVTLNRATDKHIKKWTKDLKSSYRKALKAGPEVEIEEDNEPATVTSTSN